MEGLRLILLAVGIAVVVGVYLYSRRTVRVARREEPVPDHEIREPHVVIETVDDELPEDLPPLRAGGEDADGDIHRETAGGGSRKAPSAAPPRDEKIIALTILPLDPDARIPGADLLDVFDRAGLEYGQYEVFHRMKETPDGPQSVFSVASATEPGSFDITTMADETFRGLSLFMLLPGPVRGVDAFADMLATARRIAEQIRGEVKDRNRSTLTRQTARHIREEIIAFEHRLQHGGGTE